MSIPSISFLARDGLACHVNSYKQNVAQVVSMIFFWKKGAFRNKPLRRGITLYTSAFIMKVDSLNPHPAQTPLWIKIIKEIQLIRITIRIWITIKPPPVWTAACRRHGTFISRHEKTFIYIQPTIPKRGCLEKKMPNPYGPIWTKLLIETFVYKQNSIAAPQTFRWCGVKFTWSNNRVI